MTTLLIIVHVLVCLFLIGIVLLQHGKGADIGATFGGSSQSLFGSEGPVPLLNKITTFSAIVFMGTSITLAYISAHNSTRTVMNDLSTKSVPPIEQTAPAASTEPVTVPMPPTDAKTKPADPAEKVQPAEPSKKSIPQEKTN